MSKFVCISCLEWADDWTNADRHELCAVRAYEQRSRTNFSRGAMPTLRCARVHVLLPACSSRIDSSRCFTASSCGDCGASIAVPSPGLPYPLLRGVLGRRRTSGLPLWRNAWQRCNAKSVERGSSRASNYRFGGSLRAAYLPAAVPAVEAPPSLDPRSPFAGARAGLRRALAAFPARWSKPSSTAARVTLPSCTATVRAGSGGLPWSGLHCRLQAWLVDVGQLA